jgi:hypothetical protein
MMHHTDATCRELQLASLAALTLAYLVDWKVAMLTPVATGYMAFVSHLILEPDVNVGHRAGAEGYDGANITLMFCITRCQPSLNSCCQVASTVQASGLHASHIQHL